MDDSIRSRRLCLCFRRWRVAVCLWFVCAPAAWSAPQLEISPFGYRIEQIAAVSGAVRVYDVTARAGVANSRDVARSVTAQLAGGNAGVMVLDGQLSFGDVGRTALLSPAISLDTFKLRFTLPQSVSLWGTIQFFQSALGSLTWNIGCGNCGTNRAPAAHAGANQTVYLGQPVTLDGSGSSDPDGQSLKFVWSAVSLPAGSQAVLSGATTIRPTFVADKEGSYVFRLVVNDGAVDSAPATTTVTTRNSAPVAHAGPDRTATVGARIRLDGSDSTDVDGDALTYEWTLLNRPENSAAQLLDADPASPLAGFSIDKPGRYVAELVVHDGGQESAPDTAVISTINSAPVANAGPDRTSRVGALVELSAAGSSDADGDPLTYRWSLTVPAGSQTTLTTHTGVVTSFAIDRAGTYVVQLLVNDGTLDSAAATAVISTLNSVPVAHAGNGVTVDPGTEVTLDGSASTDPDGDALGFSWSLASAPPGSAAQLSAAQTMRPQFVADLPGLYVVQLLVHDGVVNSEPVTVSIVVRDLSPPPPSTPDVDPPAAPNIATIGIQRAAAGQVQVRGLAGSVEGGAQVVVSNFVTGEMALTTAAADGSFLVLIAASDSDALLVAARDAAGNQGVATGIGALIGIELTLHTPLPNQALSGSSVLVSGALRAPENTGVTVNGKPAAVYFNAGESIFEVQLQLVPPEGPGETLLPVPIEITAYSPDGRSVMRTVTVRVRTFDTYTLQASPADGPAPLRTAFELTDNFGRGIARIDWDFDGNGVTDVVSQNPTDSPEWTYTESGTYVATARITDGAGSVHQALFPIHVYGRAAFAANVQAVWNSMASSLSRGNTLIAQARLNESARRRYGPAFQALLPDMPQTIASFSPPQLTEAGSDIAEFVVTREIEGTMRAFFVYLTRDGDGVWRVAGM